jgi:hypothetical protein
MGFFAAPIWFITRKLGSFAWTDLGSTVGRVRHRKMKYLGSKTERTASGSSAGVGENENINGMVSAAGSHQRKNEISASGVTGILPALA